MCEGVDVWITHIGGIQEIQSCYKSGDGKSTQIIYLWAFAYFESDV
jgi:hypothetical protein